MLPSQPQTSSQAPSPPQPPQYFFDFLQGKKKLTLQETGNEREEKEQKASQSQEEKEEKEGKEEDQKSDLLWQEKQKYDLLWQILAFTPFCQKMCLGLFYTIPNYFPWDLNVNKSELATWQNLHTIMTNNAYASGPNADANDDDNKEAKEAKDSKKDSGVKNSLPFASESLGLQLVNKIILQMNEGLENDDSPAVSATLSSSAASSASSASPSSSSSSASSSSPATQGSLSAVPAVAATLRIPPCFMYKLADLDPPAAASPASAASATRSTTPLIATSAPSAKNPGQFSVLKTEDIEKLHMLKSCQMIKTPESKLNHITLREEVVSIVELFFSENYDNIYPLFACRNALEDFAQDFLKRIIAFANLPLNEEFDFSAQDKIEQEMNRDGEILKQVINWMRSSITNYKPYKFYTFLYQEKKENEEEKKKNQLLMTEMKNALAPYLISLMNALASFLQRYSKLPPEIRTALCWIFRIYLRECLFLLITMMLKSVCKSHWEAITQPSNANALYKASLPPYVQTANEEYDMLKRVIANLQKTVAFFDGFETEEHLKTLWNTKTVEHQNVFVGKNRDGMLKLFSANFSDAAKRVLMSEIEKMKAKKLALLTTAQELFEREKAKPKRRS